MTRVSSPEQEQELREFAIEAARLLSDRHCEDIVLIDVSRVSQVCDYLLVASGTSDRQMKSVAAELEDLGETFKQKCFRSNRDTATTWIVIDFIDLVTHLFEPTQRDYYALEELWSDGDPVEWQRDTADGSA